MIIICAGDSFTAGAELWEEKHIPGYVSMSFRQALAEQMVETKSVDIYKIKLSSIIKTELSRKPLQEIIEDVSNLRKNFVFDRTPQRQEYSYSGIIKNLLGCKVINIGISGGSQLEILSKIVSTLYSLRKINADEKIILIAQHTSMGRAWLGQNKNSSLVLSSSPMHFNELSDLDFYEIKHIHMKYNTEEFQKIEHHNQLLTIMNICSNLNIHLIQFFSINDCELDIISNDKSCITTNMSKKLLNHYGSNRYLLPMGHFNCESNEIIAHWLVQELKKQNVI
jgi:hypothetical protein